MLGNEKQSEPLWGSIANFKTLQQVLQACPMCVRGDYKSKRKGAVGATRRKRQEEEGVKRRLTARPLLLPDVLVHQTSTLIHTAVSVKKI